MQLSQVIIYVPEVEEAMNFYQEAFGLEIAFLHESKLYGEMNTGQTKLAFAAESMAEMNHLTLAKNSLAQNAAGFELALATPEVKKAYEKALQKGATAISEPEEKPWGQTVAYVRDLNGCLVELCSLMNCELN